MINTFYRKWIILGILFLLPVIFLLFLYPSTHNYNTLDIVNEDIKETYFLNFIDNRKTNFEGNITILNFLGDMPVENITGTLNLKELVYDKFKGFKKFQIISIASLNSEKSLENVKKELLKSRKNYRSKKGTKRYYTRKKMQSFKSKTSPHILNA